MTNLEFADFLQKLKQNKISNAKLGRYFGYGATSISHFATGKRPLPLVLGRACKFVERLADIGLEFKNIMK
jgi:hypothetical protein